MEFSKSFLAIWFSIGTVLTTATQLRFTGLPVGPGEIMLIIWLVLATLTLLRDKRSFQAPVTKIFFSFWSISGLLLAAGCWIALYLGLWNKKTCCHDVSAFLFIFLVFLIFLLKSDNNGRIQQVSNAILSFSIVPLLFLLLYAQKFQNLGPIKLWSYDRFLGWAINPNQIAFLVGVVPFVGFHFFTQCKKLTQKIWYGFLILGSFIVGCATKCDALMYSWIISILFFIILLIYRGTFKLSKAYNWKVLIYSLLPLVVFCVFLMHGHDIYGGIKNSVVNTYNENNQGSIRKMLCYNGLKAISASPIFGLGPGAFSGYLGAFHGEEIHNTFLDWGCSTGIIGMLIYIGLLIWVASLAWARKNIPLFIAMINISILSLFHYVLRHPIFWFYLLMISITCQSSKLQQNRFASINSIM